MSLAAGLLAVSDAQMLMWFGVGVVLLWGMLRLFRLMARLLFKLVLVLVVVAAVVWAIWVVGG